MYAPFKPTRFKDFVGNKKKVEHLATLIKASKALKRPVPHLGFYGYAGTGKTTLASILANEYGAHFLYYNAAALRDFKNFAMDLLQKCRTHLKNEFGVVISKSNPDFKETIFEDVKGKPIVVMLDEAHAMTSKTQIEFLSLLSEGTITIQDRGKVKTGIVPFEITFILATTDKYKLSEPIQRRLEPIELQPYSENELETIATKFVQKSGFSIKKEVAATISKRSLSAGRCVTICERCLEYAAAADKKVVTEGVVFDVFDHLGIDKEGFTDGEKRILMAIHQHDGRASLEVIATLSQFPKREITETIEPQMIRKGLIRINSGGRELTTRGMAAIGVDASAQEIMV